MKILPFQVLLHGCVEMLKDKVTFLGVFCYVWMGEMEEYVGLKLLGTTISIDVSMFIFYR